jgi:hypothetical protein
MITRKELMLMAEWAERFSREPNQPNAVTGAAHPSPRDGEAPDAAEREECAQILELDAAVFEEAGQVTQAERLRIAARLLRASPSSPLQASNERAARMEEALRFAVGVLSGEAMSKSALIEALEAARRALSQQGADTNAGVVADKGR